MKLFIAGALLAMLLGACVLPRPTQNVLPSQYYPAIEEPSTTLLIMLPGIQDSMLDFKRNGLVDLVHEIKPDWDMLAVDAHIGYYRQRSIIDRLREDIVVPAHARGYDQIWLTGPSLGGFGSLLYACRDSNKQVDGVIAIAPYLGERAILKAIDNAGGAANWQAQDAGEVIERELWTCLRDTPAAELWLGWGSEDRMRRGNALLAELLLPEQVFNRPGGHRWDIWIELWREILQAQDDLARILHE